MKTQIYPYNLAKYTNELKNLIAEYPDYPIVILAGLEVANEDYYYTLCDSVSFKIGEILDCEVPYNSDFLCTNREEFAEKLGEWLWEEIEDEKDPDEPMMTNEEFEKILAEEISKFEPYWKKVIGIFADVY